jgi:hypothetical protein
MRGQSDRVSLSLRFLGKKPRRTGAGGDIAARVVEAEYEWPFQSHASMGPACAVFDASGVRLCRAPPERLKPALA